MATFVDQKNTSWTVEFDGLLIGRIRARWSSIDFGRRPHEALQELSDDPVLLEEVLYAICERDAHAAGVDREEFARRIKGAALDSATESLLEALEDFSPPRLARQVQALRKMIQATATAQQVGAERLLARVPEIDQCLTASIERDVDQALAKLLTRTPTAPPSTESPPATPLPDKSQSTPSD